MMEFKILGDICNIVSGGTPPRSKSQYWDNGNIPWIKIRDIKSKYIEDSEESITIEGLNNSSTKLLTKGTVLYTIFATLGEVGILKIDACTNQAIAGLTVKDETKILPEYLYYYLKSKKNIVNKLGRGAAQNNINLSMLKSFEIEIIDIIKQNNIIRTLNYVDNLIKLKSRELELLDELVKARFVEFFGDAIHNDKRWKTDTVENLCKEIYGGGTPSKSHPEYYEDGDIPWVSSKDMKTEVLTDSQIKINQLGVDNSAARMVPINSVIMVIRSGILKHTLPVAINVVPITVNQDLKVFIPNERVLTRFLAVQFKMHEKDILSGVRAVTADNIEFNSLKQRKLIVPPIDVQQEYVTFLEQIDKSRFIIKSMIKEGLL